MKVSELIAKLQVIQKYGDFEVRIKDEEDDRWFSKVKDAMLYGDEHPHHGNFVEIIK